MPMPEGVDHITYVITGVVDGAVVQKQAEDRYKRLGEVTVVHYHKQDDTCPAMEKRKCRIFKKHTHITDQSDPDDNCPEDCNQKGDWYVWLG